MTTPKKNRFVFVRCDHLADPGFDTAVTVYKLRDDGGFPDYVAANYRILNSSNFGMRGEAVRVVGEEHGLKHSDYEFASPDNLMMGL